MREKLSPAITALHSLRVEGQMPEAVARRITDGALARLDRRRRQRRILWLATPSVVLAAIALLLWLRPASDSPQIFEVGTVVALTPPPSAVHASDARRLTVPFGPHRAKLEPNSRLDVLSATDGDVALLLAAGRVGFDVEPLPHGRGFRIGTRDALVEVIGTRFDVALEDGCTWVSVAHGRVRVTPANSVTVELTAGMRRTFCSSQAAAQAVPGESWMLEALRQISSGDEPARAMALLERYLASYEHGIFAEDAMFHLALLYQKNNRLQDARRIADRFIERFPGSHRAQRLKGDR